MKIIAKTGPDHASPDVIVQMSAVELSLLVHCVDYKSRDVSYMTIGETFRINERYARLRELETNREQLDKAIQQIRAVATVLEPLLPIVDCPVTPDQPAPPEGEKGGGANG